MALSDYDRELLERCLARKPRAWEDFVDRFLGLVLHVVDHSARTRAVRVSPQDREDLAAEVFVSIIDSDFAVLRRFRGESSLATYLTVIARRVAVREMLRRLPHAAGAEGAEEAESADGDFPERVSDREQVEQLLAGLSQPEAEIVRLYHLEGHSYQEISQRLGLPRNSIGPILTRARSKMRSSAGADG